MAAAMTSDRILLRALFFILGSLLFAHNPGLYAGPVLSSWALSMAISFSRLQIRACGLAATQSMQYHQRSTIYNKIHIHYMRLSVLFQAISQIMQMIWRVWHDIIFI